MAALLVAMSVMAIVLSAAMPVWSQMIGETRKKSSSSAARNTPARSISISGSSRAPHRQHRRAHRAATCFERNLESPVPNKDGEFQLLYLQNQATMGTAGPGRVGTRSGSGSRPGAGPGTRPGPGSGARIARRRCPEWRSGRRVDRAIAERPRCHCRCRQQEHWPVHQDL